MTPAPLTNTSKNTSHPSRLTTDTADARVLTQIWCAMIARKYFVAPHTAPVARPNRHLGALILAKPKTPPTLRVTSAPRPAVKSP
jgi:hypothetical protein